MSLAWESVPISCQQRLKAATYLYRFAAKARFDNRPTHGVRFPKGRGRPPLPYFFLTVPTAASSR